MILAEKSKNGYEIKVKTFFLEITMCSVPKNCPNYVDSQSHKKSL